MSNVKIILVDGGEGWEKFTPLAIWYAKRARASGGNHGYAQTFVIDGMMFRVLLDDFTGDKVYIQAAPCAPILYNGFIDTYRAWDTYPMGISQRAMEGQEDDENLPRMRNGVWIEGDPTMNGFRHAQSVGGEYPKVHLKPPPANVELLRKYFDWYKPTRFTGLMRRVLQVTFATESWVDILTYKTGPTSPRQFLLDYKWGNSWGVILAPGKDGSSGDHYFLIQILTSEVRWIPAKFCVTKHSVNGKEMFAPRLVSVDSVNAVSLGSLPQYSGTSQFETIGWSFSYTAPEASVVLYDERINENYAMYTSLATMKIEFNGNEPVGVNLSVSKPSRLHCLGGTSIGSVQGLGMGLSGNVCIESFNSRRRGHGYPSRVDAPVGVFYTQDGKRVVARYESWVEEAETVTMPLTRGRVVSDPFLFAAAPIDQPMDGTKTYGSSTASVASAGGIRGEISTRPVSDSMTYFRLGDQQFEGEGILGGDFGVAPFVITSNGYYFWNLRVGCNLVTRHTLVYETGSRATRAMDAVSSFMPFPDDREAFAITCQGVKDSSTKSLSLSWVTAYARTGGDIFYSYGGGYGYGAKKWPNEPRAVKFSYTGDVYGISYEYTNGGVTTAYEPYVDIWSRFIDNGSPTGPNDFVYYIQHAPSISPIPIYRLRELNNNPSKYPYYIYENYISAYIPFASSKSESKSEPFIWTKLVTSTGVYEVDNLQFSAMALSFWDPTKPNQEWMPRMVTSAYNGYMATDAHTGRLVVKIGNKEYNVDKYVYGWIGVV